MFLAFVDNFFSFIESTSSSSLMQVWHEMFSSHFSVNVKGLQFLLYDNGSKYKYVQLAVISSLKSRLIFHVACLISLLGCIEYVSWKEDCFSVLVQESLMFIKLLLLMEPSATETNRQLISIVANSSLCVYHVLPPPRSPAQLLFDRYLHEYTHVPTILSTCFFCYPWGSSLTTSHLDYLQNLLCSSVDLLNNKRKKCVTKITFSHKLVLLVFY